ncbi:MAG: tetratricopeptide repeat protein [Cyanobacteria bacterium REEB67]|nr:tetratricopeptide repeat protein [Cyanobacteria bacterium REEB67]
MEDEQKSAALWASYMERGRTALQREQRHEAVKRFGLALAEAQNFGDDDPRLADTLFQVAQAADLGDIENTLALYNTALAAREKVSSEDDPALISILQTMAFLFCRLDRFTEAHEHQARAINIAEHNFGINHPATIKTMHAALLNRQRFIMGKPPGQYSYSVEELELEIVARLNDESRALQDKCDKENVERKDTSSGITAEDCDRLVQLADCYEALGMNAEALDLLEQRLQIEQTIYGPDSREAARCQSEVAASYTCPVSLAEEKQLEAIAILQQYHERGQNTGETRDLIDALERLSSLYSRSSRFAEVLELKQKIIALKESSPVFDPYESHRDYRSLASAYRVLQRYDESSAAYKQAIDFLESASGEESEDFADLLSEAADFEPLSRGAEAEANWRRALSIQEKILGPNDSKTAQTLGSLGQHYARNEKPTWAEPMLKRALTITQSHYHRHHHKVLSLIWILGNFYFEQQDMVAAEAILKQGLVVKKASADTMQPMLNLWDRSITFVLGNVYLSQQKYAEAEQCYKQLLPARVPGLQEPETILQLVYSLAVVYHAQHKYGEAETLYQRALDILEVNRNNNIEGLTTIAERYAEMLRADNRYDEADQLQKRYA